MRRGRAKVELREASVGLGVWNLRGEVRKDPESNYKTSLNIFTSVGLLKHHISGNKAFLVESSLYGQSSRPLKAAKKLALSLTGCICRRNRRCFYHGSRFAVWRGVWGKQVSHSVLSPPSPVWDHLIPPTLGQGKVLSSPGLHCKELLSPGPGEDALKDAPAFQREEKVLGSYKVSLLNALWKERRRRRFPHLQQVGLSLLVLVASSSLGAAGNELEEPPRPSYKSISDSVWYTLAANLNADAQD